MDTIFAPATAPGKAGVAIVRVSGKLAFRAIESLTGTLPPPRQMALRAVTVGEDIIDQALVVRFDAPNSFTGEDIVELHLHGSVAVVRATTAALTNMDGLRLALPGEFTRRALENDRMDLTEVEGLADLIEAETEVQRRQAQRILSGHIGKLVDGWRVDIIRATALLEATIDFVDEDIPVDVMPEVAALIDRVVMQTRVQLDSFSAAERVRNGFEVAIVGQPNIGKSTLLNALAGRDAAITSDVAGTTRDVIEVRMDLGGLPVTLLDTAGLRHTDNPVERLGVQRALERARNADLRVFLLASEDEKLALERQAGDYSVLGKGDLCPNGMLAVSGRTSLGIDAMIAYITRVLADRVPESGGVINDRHRSAVLTALTHLTSARAGLDHDDVLAETVSEDLRLAARAFDALIGKIGVEDVLDEIFSTFCLGK